jgi:CBS domain-containing protein
MGLLRLTHLRPEVTPETRVMDAVRVMADAQVGAIGVTKGRKIVGIFSERDLMRRVVAEGRDLETTTIQEVMTRPVETVVDSTSVGEAAAIMRARHIRHLAIINGAGDFVGLVAQRHLLYDLMGELELKVDNLEGYLMADGPGG